MYIPFETTDLFGFLVIAGFFGKIGGFVKSGFKKIISPVKKFGGTALNFVPFGGTIKSIGGGIINLAGAFGKNSGQSLSGQIRSGQTDFTLGQGRFEIGTGDKVFSVGIRQSEQGQNSGYGETTGSVSSNKGTLLAGGAGTLGIIAIVAYFILKGK